MTPIDLDALEALERAATATPWRAEYGGTCASGQSIDADNGVVYSASCDDCRGDDAPFEREEDFDFILASRNAMPALIAELKAAREALAWYADLENYQREAELGRSRYVASPVESDRGGRARTVLGLED